MPEGSRQNEQISVLPEAQSHMRYDDLKPVVRSYVDNLTDQLADLVRMYRVSHPKELIPLIETDVMRIEDVRRFGALSDALKVCFENRMPPEAKREARTSREHAMEQFTVAIKLLGTENVAQTIVKTKSAINVRELLPVLYQLDRATFEELDQHSPSLMLQCFMLEALAKNGEIDLAWKRYQATNLSEDVVNLFLPEYKLVKEIISRFGIIALEHGRNDVAERLCVDRPNDELFLKITEQLADEKKWGAAEAWLAKGRDRTVHNEAVIAAYAVLISGMNEAGKSAKRCENFVLREHIPLYTQMRRSPVMRFTDAEGKAVGQLAIALAESGSYDNAMMLFKRIDPSESDLLLPEFVQTFIKRGHEVQAGLVIENFSAASGSKALAYAELVYGLAKKGSDPRQFLPQLRQAYKEAPRHTRISVDILLSAACVFRKNLDDATMLGAGIRLAPFVSQSDIDQRNILYNNFVHTTDADETQVISAATRYGKALQETGKDITPALLILERAVDELLQPEFGQGPPSNQIFLAFSQFQKPQPELHFSLANQYIRAAKMAIHRRSFEAFISVVNDARTHDVKLPESIWNDYHNLLTEYDYSPVTFSVERMQIILSVAKAKAQLGLPISADIEITFGAGGPELPSSAFSVWFDGQIAIASGYLERANQFEVK